jgi:hypothetical protein
MKERSTDNVAVGFCFKDFAYWTGYSSVGLNVAAVTTAEELKRHGTPTYLMGVRDNIGLLDSVMYANGIRQKQGLGPLTDVIIMAPWITPLDLGAILQYFPDIRFTVQGHCNVAAIYGDHRGMGNFRNYADMTFDYPNLMLAGNSEPFVSWFTEAYGVNTYLLPDLYPIGKHHHHGDDKPRVSETDGSLRIGAFGALRPEKNIPSACAAALLIQERLGLPVSFHLNVGGERVGREILAMIDQMSQGIPNFTVIKHKWLPWSEFNGLVKTMDLLIQPSFTESFNLVTADGIQHRVPTVVSNAIPWAPDSWKANPDRPTEIAKVGIRLLRDPKSWEKGRDALLAHNKRGVKLWREFLYDRDPVPFPLPPEYTEGERQGWFNRFFHHLRPVVTKKLGLDRLG